MKPRTVALLTYSGHPTLVPEEQPLVRSLERAGYTVSVIPWDAPAPWAAYRAVIIRECWNYHKKPQEFLAWVRERKRDGTRLWNPPDTVLWNADKRYLKDLERRGVSIIPTEILSPGDGQTVASIMSDRGWGTAVVKPVFGASSQEVRLVRAGAVQDSVPDPNMGWLVQEYRPEITEGELSFVFFNGTYSHGVRKIPGRGDFRTHPDFGGRETGHVHDPSHVRMAADVLATAAGPILHARVDGVMSGGKFLLMELELIEPYLFIETDPRSADRFADAFKALDAA